MCPRGPGILLPGNYCCDSSRHQRGVAGTASSSRTHAELPTGGKKCVWNLRLAGKIGVGGTAEETGPFARDTVGFCLRP